VALDFFVATSYVLGYRLPEFYAGLPASRERFPVQYGSANIPQAWAAVSVFQLVQTILSLRADAPMVADTSTRPCRAGSRTRPCAG
jgi:glycogen debranching enzyme